ncbi:hypothetical protein C8J57DRAFT_1355919 [Mycena rebaudengoi]|nr:hypothetical protein C8J57DRAFT_1355919 [Mycena rebaudengoi]
MTSVHVYTVTLLGLFLGRRRLGSTSLTTQYATFHLDATNPDIRFRNVLLELMVGKAEATIHAANALYGPRINPLLTLGVNMSFSSRGIVWGYSVPAAASQIPTGDYHIRGTGTMHNISGLPDNPEVPLGPPLGNYTVRSQTFPVVRDHRAFACTTPKWTPIPSVDDPRFSALLIDRRLGGEAYFLKTLKDRRSLDATFVFLNEFIDIVWRCPVTLEIMKTATGASVQAQTSVWVYNVVLYFEDVRNLAVGAWKVRANYTLPNVAGAGPVSEHSAWSDEFYIASAPPCGGLFIGNSTTPEPSAATRGVRASSAAVFAFAAALVTVWMTSY